MNATGTGMWPFHRQDFEKISGHLLRDTISHLFLPRETPGTLQTNLDEVENFLIQHFSDNISAAIGEITFSQLESTKITFQKWSILHEDLQFGLNKFQTEVRSLPPNVTLPIYVRNQNCSILITNETETNGNIFTVSTFRSSFPAKMIMTSVGSHSFDFPETIEEIQNMDLLTSKTFSQLVHELAVGNISLETMTKNGPKNSEDRDVTEPRLVQDWVVGLLVPAPINQNKKQRFIRKKVRDQVCLSVCQGSSRLFPFRRSGLYLSLKVTLYLKLLENLTDESKAKYVYKLLLLRILTDVAHKLCNRNQYTNSINMDLSSQILAKLGRRIMKLETFAVKLEMDEISVKIVSMRERCLYQAQTVTQRLSTQMQNYWSSVVNLMSNVIETANEPEELSVIIEEKPMLWSQVVKGKPKPLPTPKPVLTSEMFPEIEQVVATASSLVDHDILHKLPLLDKYISKVHQFFSPGNENMTRRPLTDDEPVFIRFLDYEEIMSRGRILQTEEKRLTWLFDAENFIKFSCTDKNIALSNFVRMVKTYVDKAVQFYSNNPLGMSQILLVTLKGLSVVDKFATRECPLLLEYKPNIDFSVFDHLLLPFYKDMKLLEKLLNYFKSRENNAMFDDILSSSVNANSFSVRYAQSKLETVRERILQDTKESIEKKYIEVESVRKRCKILEEQISSEGVCKCEYETKTWINWRGKHCWKRERVFHCRKCKLQSELQSLRTSVSYYERPLPPTQYLQYAVIFELCLPETLATWRNFMIYLKYHVLGQTVFDTGNCEVSFKWLDYSKLGSYKSSNASTSIQLGSSSLPASAKHGTSNKLDVLYNKNENFIVNNGMNCIYNYTEQGQLTKCWKTACAFKINSTANPEPYKKLQFTVDSTAHFQNNVLAQQNDCHEKLSLHEYVAFGSLRAGHRIQLRNLFEALYSGTVSLEQEAVLLLILQTLWQVGPRNSDNRAESHFDFEDNEFSTEFVQMLEKLVKINEANYSNALIGLVAVVITKRIGEINHSMENICYTFLQKCRKILTIWMTKLQDELNKPEVALVQDGTISLRKNLLEIVFAAMLSFSIVDSSHLTNNLKTKEDASFLMESLFQFSQFIETPVPISGFMKIILNFIRLFPLRWDLTAQFSKKDADFYKDCVHAFISQRWSKAKQSNMLRLELPNSGNVVRVEYIDLNFRRYIITFDLILGTFLVNGYSESAMPRQIRENKLFRWYFKEGSTNLRIYQESTSLTRTTTKFHGKQYEFHRNFDDDLLIQEIHDDGTMLVLIYPTKLEGCLAKYFLDNYTHWLDRTENVVYFRSRNNVLGESSNHYKLYRAHETSWNNFWKMYDMKNSEHILSIHSDGFSDFSELLSSFELPQYINVTRAEDGCTTAHLRRYHLRFIRRPGKSVHESVEYPGYCIRKNMYKGTLVGLSQGLILENGDLKMLLVPHTTISFSSGAFHQVIYLSLEELRQPPCFDFEFDDVLKRLKARNNKSAWLYLAALHAVTSSPIPDPFTEITGTEMAVRILQSACVWSCSPYDQESLKTLAFIHSLSPNRKFYGQGQSNRLGTMEAVEWPKGLPSSAAYDGYAIIVEKLLNDSDKLSMLYSESKAGISVITNKLSNESLRMRAYFQHQTSYNAAVFVNKPNYLTQQKLVLLSSGIGKTDSVSQRCYAEKFHLANLQSVSYNQLSKSISRLKCDGQFQRNSLASFVISKNSLDAPRPDIALKGFDAFGDLLQLDFRTNWLKFYSLAVNCGKSKAAQIQFSVILSTLAYREAPIVQIVNLHCISVCSVKHIQEFPTAPFFPSGPTTFYIHKDPTSNYFDVIAIETILKANVKPFTALPRPTEPVRNFWGTSSEADKQKREKYEEDVKEYIRQKTAYENEAEKNCEFLAKYLETNFWPCEKILIVTEQELPQSQNIKILEALKQVNELVPVWFRNYQLKLFIIDVQERLNMVYDLVHQIDPMPAKLVEHSLEAKFLPAKVQKRTKLRLEFANLLLPCALNNFRSIANIFESGVFKSTKNKRSNTWQARKQRCEQKIDQLRSDIVDKVTGNVYRKIASQTGIFPRLDPGTILSQLKSSSDKDNPMLVYAGAFAVVCTHLKRINRCIRAQNETDIARESKNPGHQNWSPRDFPEWLLLELELDIMIRPVQVDVAIQMMKMPDGGNGVTQLNMGEGKTSVIVPMLCSSLAKTNFQLCRITVLSSMFKMNLNSLTFAIGGLLNQRVYTVPSRRDMIIDTQCVSRIQACYEECIRLRSIVLTLPEYRLSFRLLVYDNLFKENYVLGQQMLGIENWLRYHVRDILDESDELFSVKYQLVYTIGTPRPIDGGDLRWTTCQKILSLVLKVAQSKELQQTVGENFLEFNFQQQEEKPHQFSFLRIINSDYTERFLALLTDKILEEKRLLQKEKEVIKRFLTQTNVSFHDYRAVMHVIFHDSPDELQKILLLSGYLRRGVLGLALLKRWRVEYGVNPKSGFRRMAVPFRAKDVAAEKTEFGHPDLAIILTHLSYYYSGLDNDQLQHTFDLLKGKQAPDGIYSKWISAIPEEQVPEFLQRYHSLNMKDAYQKSRLFEMLRQHKMVIDFWLGHCVFPRESKQFPGKLVMTPWDLCYQRQRFPVTGFSGTNDSKSLLPLMIKQQDLEELQDTNQNMEKTLLQPENGNHKGFRMGVTCREVLESMKADNLTVLIDAGALMLECSNVQVADLWLNVNPELEAAIYFSKDNELLVKCRGDKHDGTPFDVSPYQGRLEKCGIFLDDQHTRGTDIKFPLGAKACVTVATRMKRDKLIQACMRMRKLGQGHCVTFYLSHEAHDKVTQQIKMGEITTKLVLDWVCQNTEQSNKDGLLYWALAGKNYAQRLAAEDIFHSPYFQEPFVLNVSQDELKEKAEVLATQCVDDEVIKLEDMYGQYTKVALLYKLVPVWFDYAKRKIQQINKHQQIDERIWLEFDSTCRNVQKRCLEKVPDKEHVASTSGMMEEEQEKELELEKEREVEEERHVQRPRQATPATHYLHPNVEKAVVYGQPLSVCSGIESLPRVFRGTTFWKEVQPSCWNRHVFATRDFRKTIQENSLYFQTDSFLRPIQYLITLKNNENSVEILLLSPFEVNELMPRFRRNIATTTLRMFSLRRTEKQDLLLNNSSLQLPHLENVNHIPDTGVQVASLLLASGSLYFASMTEQKAFVKFLGLVPQPWTKEENAAFEEGRITKSGFFLPEYRNNVGMGFDKDPSTLVRKILGCRHPVVSEVTHIMRLLEENLYIDLP